MSQLTDRTLALLLQQQRTLLDAGTLAKIALNLSTVVLRDPTLPDRIEAAMRDADVPAELVEFEVTETSLLHDSGAVLPLLRRLRALGSSLALDDFGQGFSSLSHLRNLEADGIKIDKAFIDDLLTSSVDETIVAAVISLGHELGMVVTAEGVEHADQAARLGALGCDRLQGYHFGRPRPAHEIVTLLSGRQVPG
jgi:EAL domain-containing protein (putative c-di-GMP-specific phosphodiesterase class I)